MRTRARRRVVLSWSSGKDSAWALWALRHQPELEVVGLLTTINESVSRVAMHAVREELLERQAAAARLPLLRVPIPDPCSNEQYEAAMARALGELDASGIRQVAFGDLFLSDIRQYREQKMAARGFTALFPIWGHNTYRLAHEMLDGGLRAVVTTVDPRQLAADFVGRTYDYGFVSELPRSADPCGENGEFHSFAYAGPMFDQSIAIETGERLERGGFHYADVRAAS